VNLILGEKDVHVWCASLDRPTSTVQSYAGLLSDDEQERAKRFHFSRDRDHFIISRGLLRKLLGRYLAIKPILLEFHYTRYGKPFLQGCSEGSVVNFNLSHSHGKVIIAITRGREVGIDIEHIRTVPEADHIAEQNFSCGEYAAYQSLPESRKQQGFFNCWTRKEAFIKAVGEGLSLPLDQFEVSLAPDEPAKLKYIEGDPGGIARWSLQALKINADYAAAIVVEGTNCRIVCYEWTD